MEQNYITSEFQRLCNVGYWYVSKRSEQIYISEYLREILQINNEILTFSELLEFVPSRFRESYREYLQGINPKLIMDVVFPIKVGTHRLWIRLIKTKTIRSKHAWGIAHLISTSSLGNRKRELDFTPHNMLVKMNAFSHSINRFVDQNDSHNNIISLMHEIIHQLNVDRAYLFVYNHDRNEHECIATAAKRQAQELQLLYKKFPNTILRTLTKRSLNGKPNIIDNIHKTKQLDKLERDILLEHSVVSIMTIPLRSNNQTWGFIGVDMANRSHCWSGMEYEWLNYLTSILNPFLQIKLRLLEQEQNTKLLSDNFQQTKSSDQSNSSYTYIIATLLLNEQGDIIQETVNDSRYKIHNRKLSLFHSAFLDKQLIQALKEKTTTSISVTISWLQLDQFLIIIGPHLTAQFQISVQTLSQLQSSQTYYQCTIALLNHDINTPIKGLEHQELCNYISHFAGIGIFQYNSNTKEICTNNQWQINSNNTSLEWKSCLEKVRNIIHSEDSDILFHRIRQLCNHELEETRVEYRIINGNQWKWIRAHIYALPSRIAPGQYILLSLNSDITNIKQLEQKLIRMQRKASEADKMKSSFIANISHELRTPLNAIVGLSDILDETESPQERNEYITIIKKNNQLLLGLIDDIIRVSQIETEQFTLEPSRFDLNSLCHEIIDKVSYRICDQTTIDFIPDNTHSYHLFHDKEKLTIIITNLITNASKFTQNGTITLRYKAFNNSIRFSIEDTGIGISSEQMKTIFNRFVKISSFTPGNGLGLFICKRLVHKMGGDIGVNSKLGKGSKFWFKLPILDTID